MTLKKVKENWINEFTNHLDKAENKEFRKIRKYYQEQYYQAIESFLKKRQTTGFDRLFQSNQLTDAFSDIYSNIGVSFAVWYSKNFERLVKRQDVSNYKDTWQETFAAEGKRIAGKRVTLVQGTAKATLTKELTRFMRNPEFMSLNEREASRVLRSRFNQYSNFQAKRLVRTEATNAANLGVMRSALDMFGADSLEKEWIAALDERVRSWHGEANGQVVAFNEKFSVGGELLDRAGDPAGSARNVINCRCSIAPFPKEDAEAISQIDSLEFDIAQEAFDPSSFGLTSRTVAPVVESVVEYQFLPDNWSEIAFEDTDKTILQYLKEPIKANKSPISYSRKHGRMVEDGSWYNDKERKIQIATKRYSEKKTRQKIIAHEFGHAINKDLDLISWNWTSQGYKVKANTAIKKMYDNHRARFVNSNGNLTKEGKSLSNKFGGGKTTKTAHKITFLNTYLIKIN